MPARNPVGTELILDACLKWPDLPSNTIARMLFKEHPQVWRSKETVRSAVLFRRGRNKSTMTKRRKPSIVVPSTAPRKAWNPMKLPPSHEGSFLPHEVTVAKTTRVLVLGDIHLPYHNLAALEATLRHAKQQNVGVIILNGDTLDFHQLSRFQKEPGSRDTAEEIAAANQLLDYIDQLLPKARKIWKNGNHDERFDLFLQARAPELFKTIAEHAALDRLLGLAERGWEYVTLKRPIYLGALTLIHGHEYPTPVLGPVNAARGLFLRAKDSAMVSHHHQTSEHTEPTIRDKMITTWSLGCLCDLHPMYARFNKWNHGAAICELAANGHFQVRNFRIVGGKLLN